MSEENIFPKGVGDSLLEEAIRNANAVLIKNMRKDFTFTKENIEVLGRVHRRQFITEVSILLNKRLFSEGGEIE